MLFKEAKLRLGNHSVHHLFSLHPKLKVSSNNQLQLCFSGGSKLACAGTQLIENSPAHGASKQCICRNNCKESALIQRWSRKWVCHTGIQHGHSICRFFKKIKESLRRIGKKRNIINQIHSQLLITFFPDNAHT
jgi:hypothetical protein